MNEKEILKSKIIEVIINCLTSGERLPSEKELTENFNISRSTLRELLIEFETSGIIVATQGKGREVKLPDVSNTISGGWGILLKVRPESILDLLNIRFVLERGFLPTVIDSLKLEDLQVMRDLVDRMAAKAKRNEPFIEEDEMFHRIMYSRTDNMLLNQLLKAFWELLEQKEEWRRSDDLIEAAEIHSQLFQAIIVMDYEEADRLLEIQFKDVLRRLKLFLGEKPEDIQ